jgi:hypothetical protein
MSFINKSVNYSQTILLKKSFLLKDIKLYNDFLLKLKNKDSINVYNNVPILNVNNHKKYYLYIIKKSKLDNSNSNFNILYFFPDSSTLEFYKDDLLIKNKLNEFFIEINSIFEDDLLLEGYIYTKKETPLHYHYCITDILVRNESIVDCNYQLRYTLLNEILMNKKLDNLNDNLTISLHHIIYKNNMGLISVLLENFKYKNELCCIEEIDNYNKKIIKYIDPSFQLVEKYISKGKYSDVYDVLNISSKESDGILYVKGIKESKKLKELFKKSETKYIKLTCEYNKSFNKWQPIF